RRSSATRSSAASCPARRPGCRGVRKVRQIARPDSDEGRRTSYATHALRITSRLSATASHRCARASPRPCDVATKRRGTRLALHAERPSSLGSATREKEAYRDDHSTEYGARHRPDRSRGAHARVLRASRAAGGRAGGCQRPALQPGDKYSGRATVLQARVLDLSPVVLAD